MTDSKRVREAKAADRAELLGVYRSLVRTPEDAAALLIASFEAETGLTATAGDWAEARESVRRGL